MNFIHAPSPQLPLSSKTNAPRMPRVHFKLPVLKKSAPTVSVTNANAARTSPSAAPLSTITELSQNSVAFPSTPIPCPAHRKRAVSEDGYLVSSDEFCENATDEDSQPQPDTPRRSVSRSDIVRRRNKSCLASSYFHHDSHKTRQSPAPAPAEKPPVSEKPPANRAHARRESMSTGTPSGKDVRKARRALADAQFLASVHTSVSSHVRARMGPDGPRDEYAAQDVILVERIWQALVDLGYKPVPLEPPSHVPPPSTEESAREVAERAARKTTAAVSSTPVTLGRVQPVQLAPAGVLAAPQLVAVLIMRHRDRSTTRPRSAAKQRGDQPQPPARSPLSTAAAPAPTAVP